MTRWASLIAIVAGMLLPAQAPAAEVINGGFETGTLAGWEVRQLTGAGNWYAYKGSAPPIPHERGAVAVQPPPQGQHAAITDQLNPEALLLFQDLRLEPGTSYRLSLLAYYNSYAALEVPSPDTLLAGQEAIGSKVNQQFRIDLVRPEAAPESVAAEDVLLNLFRTRSGGARELSPTRLEASLAPFAGQTVRLRIAVASTEEVLNAGIDAVTLSAPDGTFAVAPGGRLRPRKPHPNRRKGTVALPVGVPGAGRLAASSRTGKIRRVSVQADQEGIVVLQLRPTRKTRRALERRHKLRVGITLTWRPLSGGQQKLRVPVVFLRKS